MPGRSVGTRPPPRRPGPPRPGRPRCPPRPTIMTLLLHVLAVLTALHSNAAVGALVFAGGEAVGVINGDFARVEAANSALRCGSGVRADPGGVSGRARRRGRRPRCGGGRRRSRGRRRPAGAPSTRGRSASSGTPSASGSPATTTEPPGAWRRAVSASRSRPGGVVGGHHGHLERPVGGGLGDAQPGAGEPRVPGEQAARRRRRPRRRARGSARRPRARRAPTR